MPLEDKMLGVRIQREFTKRASMDSSDVRIHCAGGTVYLNGKVKAVRGAIGIDMQKEVEIVCRNLRTIPGVRDVVDELDKK